MKAYIFTGGEIYHEHIAERPEEGDLVISADAGYRNATLMGDDSEKVLISVAHNPNTSVDVLKKLEKNTSVYVSDAAKEELKKKLPKDGLVSNLSTSEKMDLAETSTDKDVLDDLAKDENEYVLNELAKNPNLSPESLDKLSNNPSTKIRGNVAQNPNTSQETLKKLAGDESNFVVIKVVTNYNADSDVLKQVAKNAKYESTLIGLAKHPNSTGDILKYVGEKTKDEITKQFLAKHPNVPQSTLEQLSKSSNINVLLEVAKNPKTSNEILEKLANDNTTYWAIREEAKKNLQENGNKKPVVLKPAKPNKEKAQKLLDNMSVKDKTNLVSKEDCPVKIMEMLANTSNTLTHDDVIITGKILQHPNCPEKIKWDVVNSNPNFSGTKVTLAMVGNPTIEMLDKMAEDKNVNVKTGVIGSPKTTPELIDKAIKHSDFNSEDDSGNLIIAAENPKTSAQTLDYIISNNPTFETTKIKTTVISNPNTSFDTLKKLIDDDNTYVQEVAHDYSVSRGFGDNLPKFKFKGDDKTYAIIRSKFEKQVEDKEQTDTIYAEMAMFSRDKVAPMGVYHGRTKEQLKADFIKNMNPANYESAESFHKAQERVKKLSALDFSRMLASIFAEDEEDE